jgi:hypothetical protein
MMLVEWSVHGAVPEERLAAVRALFPAATQRATASEVLPAGWAGVLVRVNDRWLVPIDASLNADRGVQVDLWEDLTRGLGRCPATKSLLLTGAVAPLAGDARRAVLLERPQGLCFAVQQRDLPRVVAAAVEEDPWWPGFMELAERGSLFAEPSLSLQTTARRLPELVPDRPFSQRSWLSRHLRTTSVAAFLPKQHVATEATAVRAGLLIWHDFLDEGHGQAQNLEGVPPGRGDHWHAIMHRREPDYANARYWFRRIQRPAWFAALAKFAQESAPRPPDDSWAHWIRRLVGPQGWDPLAFVDFCEACASGDLKLDWFARQVQRAEMELLLADSLGQ